MRFTTLVCSVLLGLALAPAESNRAHAQDQNPAEGSARFIVRLRGNNVGSETVTVARTPTGWIISSSGRLSAPAEIVTNKFEVTYAPDWQPHSLLLEGTYAGKPMKLSTSFGLSTAITDVVQGEQTGTVTHTVSARTTALPNNVYAGYEVLAARLATAAVGARLPAYVVPQTEVLVAVNRITPRRISTPSTSWEIRQFDLTLNSASGSLPIEMWIDEHHRLAKLTIPATSTTVVREDFASVLIREELVRRITDTQVSIAADGFSLAATVSVPSPRVGVSRWPAVVLVPGSGTVDREQAVNGVPIFGHIANALADAGFVVVRYDRRGSGQSGGRVESSSMTEFADDILRAVDWTSRRKDVDADRVAVVSYGEGGPAAMVAAAKGGRIRALGLLASPGLSGRDTVLEQQRRALARQGTADADIQAKVALQKQLLDAVVSGKGWDALPPAMRETADTPDFKSWILFDPAPVVAKIERPLLILQGALDAELPTAHADRLAELGKRRKVSSTLTKEIVVPGVNHMLVAANTGAVDEYPLLRSSAVSTEVTTALATWLLEALAVKR